MFPPSKRRSYVEIIMDILTIAQNGARITHIVYGANLNFQRAMKYLEVLRKKGFIEASKDPKNPKRIIYKTTKRGLEFLTSCNKVQNMLQELETIKYIPDKER